MLDADVLVVGLGIHGAASAYALSELGLRVIGIDQFGSGHVRGSSHGPTRMIRRAYPNPIWNGLVERAYTAWERWQEAAGVALIHRTGGLYAHPADSPLQGPGCVRLDAPDEFVARMPSFSVPAGHGCVYDPEAGVIDAAAALTYARSAATDRAAELSFDEALVRWSQVDGGVRVVTSRRELVVGKLVLAAGAWAGKLVPELAGLFEVWRILTVTLRPGQPIAQPPRLGAFSVDRPEGLVFGIPDAYGEGFKLGVDARQVWDPASPPAPPSPTEISELLDLIADLVPDIDLADAEAASCLYTMTEDKRFVVDRLPWAPDVVVAAACSGHGFKFGPAIGEAVADLCRTTPRPDLEFIGLTRRGY